MIGTCAFCEKFGVVLRCTNSACGFIFCNSCANMLCMCPRCGTMGTLGDEDETFPEGGNQQGPPPTGPDAVNPKPVPQGPPCPHCGGSLPPDAEQKHYRLCMHCRSSLFWFGGTPYATEAEQQNIANKVLAQREQKSREEAQRKANRASALLDDIRSGAAKGQLNDLLAKVDEYLSLRPDDGEIQKLRQSLIDRESKRLAENAARLKQATKYVQGLHFSEAAALLEAIPESRRSEEVSALLALCRKLESLRNSTVSLLTNPGDRNSVHTLKIAREYRDLLARTQIVDPQFAELLSTAERAYGLLLRRRLKVAGAVAVLGLVAAGLWSRSSARHRALQSAIAQSRWDDALSIDPANVTALVGRARRKLESDPADVAGAFTDLNQAVAHGKEVAVVQVARGDAYAARAREYALTDQLDEAAKDLAQAHREAAKPASIAAAREAVAAGWILRAHDASKKRDASRLRQAVGEALKVGADKNRLLAFWLSYGDSRVKKLDAKGLSIACAEGLPLGLSPDQRADWWRYFGDRAANPPHEDPAAVRMAVDNAKGAGVAPKSIAQLSAAALMLEKTALSPEEAESLAKEQYPLRLSGVRAITPDVAEALAGHDGILFLNGLASLSPQIAEALAKHQGYLFLGGLTTLSPEVAEALAKHQGGLSFDGLTTLTPEVAEALAKHQGPLSLDGLTTLSPEVTEKLAKHQRHLSLNGLTTLPSIALAEGGKCDSLDGLTTLTPEIAKELAEGMHQLSLPALRELTPDVAVALANNRGLLLLDGLTTLTPEVAGALAKHEGRLSLGALSILSPEVAEALAKHEGYLSLDGLTTLSPEVAEALAKPEGHLSLEALTILTPQIAEALAKHQGYLFLGGLTTLSPEVAEALAKHKGTLYLSRLKSLTPQIAEVLAKHEGDLSLRGLTTLSPEVAEALAKHKGDLSIYGLTTLTPEAAETLRKKPRIALPEKFMKP